MGRGGGEVEKEERRGEGYSVSGRRSVEQVLDNQMCRWRGEREKEEKEGGRFVGEREREEAKVN